MHIRAVVRVLPRSPILFWHEKLACNQWSITTSCMLSSTRCSTQFVSCTARVATVCWRKLQTSRYSRTAISQARGDSPLLRALSQSPSSVRELPKLYPTVLYKQSIGAHGSFSFYHSRYRRISLLTDSCNSQWSPYESDRATTMDVDKTASWVVQHNDWFQMYKTSFHLQEQLQEYYKK